MLKFEDIKEPLKRALISLHTDRTKFKLVSFPKMTAEKIEQAVGNHLFNDYYMDLNITEMEGHMIREFFESTVYGSGKDYIIKLHENFPEIMETEDPRFIRDVNQFRKKLGLEVINY